MLHLGQFRGQDSPLLWGDWLDRMWMSLIFAWSGHLLGSHCDTFIAKPTHFTRAPWDFVKSVFVLCTFLLNSCRVLEFSGRRSNLRWGKWRVMSFILKQDTWESEAPNCFHTDCGDPFQYFAKFRGPCKCVSFCYFTLAPHLLFTRETTRLPAASSILVSITQKS